MENRRVFLRKSCIAGLCLCGFPSVMFAGTTASTEPEAIHDPMWQNWIARLLQNMHDTLSPEQCRELMYSCAGVHYDQLQMEKILQPFEGHTAEFCDFLQKEWGWKVDYRKNENLIVANENKTKCVCPLVNPMNGHMAASLCYCSEAFAARMFGKVTGRKVEARVLASLHRGDPHCIYQIKIVT